MNGDYLEINLVFVSFLEAVLPAGDGVSRGIVTLGEAVGGTNLETTGKILQEPDYLIFAFSSHYYVKVNSKCKIAAFDYCLSGIVYE